MVERLARRGSAPFLLGVVAAGAMALAAGCGRSNRQGLPPHGNVPSDGGDPDASGGKGATGTGGTSTGGTGTGGASGSSTGGGSGEGGDGNPSACGVVPSGVVRLSFRQVRGALDALVGVPAAEEITTGLDLPTNETAALPALGVDGQEIGDAPFTQFDLVAQRTGAYVRANIESVTGCAATLTDECARAFVADFAERAFRKPAEGTELDLVLGVYDAGRADLGATVEEALEAGVYAALESPRFTYRFELGAPDAVAGAVPLEPYELANALSFFLTAGPPDAELLAAAAAGTLASPADLEPHVARLLTGNAARSRLQGAVGAHFRLMDVRNAIFDAALFPAWTPTIGPAMIHETQLFLGATLWSEPLPSLLTSRSTWVNEELAALYGTDFPPAGQTPDADGFAPTELGEKRSGLLTQASMLTVAARPDGSSIIRRAMHIHQRFLCQPPLPAEGAAPSPEAIVNAIMATADLSEREKASFRVSDPLCVDCHGQHDQYGIALEEFDAIGRERTVDEVGEPVDPAITLPEAAGSARVANAADLGRVLAESDTVARCLGSAFLREALSDRWQVTDQAASCEVDEIMREYAAGGDASFGGLVRAIALSPTFRERTKP